MLPTFEICPASNEEAAAANKKLSLNHLDTLQRFFIMF
jgi:hypothetical protein